MNDPIKRKIQPIIGEDAYLKLRHLMQLRRQSMAVVLEALVEDEYDRLMAVPARPRAPAPPAEVVAQ